MISALKHHTEAGQDEHREEAGLHRCWFGGRDGFRNLIETFPVELPPANDHIADLKSAGLGTHGYIKNLSMEIIILWLCAPLLSAVGRSKPA